MLIPVEISLLFAVAVGCYQPAGPMIPMSPGWDPRKLVQASVQQLAFASPGSAVQAVTSQTMITTSTITSASHPHSTRSHEEYVQVPAASRPTAESVPAKPQRMVSPGSVEIGVGTHSSDRKSSRSRSFHSSIRPSEKPRNPAANVPVGAAHLVVPDQEHELDLSWKGNAHSCTGIAATVVTTHESIIKPAIGVVHEVIHGTVTTSSGMSQIGHLERFVHGLMTSENGLPVTQEPQTMSLASNNSQTTSPHDDPGVSPAKRQPEQVEESAEERENISPKKSKYAAGEEECSSEVQESVKDEVQPSCSTTAVSEAVVDNPPSGDDASALAAVKQDCEFDKDTSDAVPLPDVLSTLSQSCEDQQIQHTAVEEVDQPTDAVETIDSCELVIDDPSLSPAAISEKNYLPSPSKETPDTELVENPKIKDSSSSSNPKKGVAAGTAESKQRMSPVRSKNVTELNKKRTQTVSPQEKRSEKAGSLSGEKSGRRSADEGSMRSTSARRKRDTGGWEWCGDPETKPVYFKVIWLCQYLYVQHTHTGVTQFNSPFSGTTSVSRYQKGKTNLDFAEARDSEWQ